MGLVNILLLVVAVGDLPAPVTDTGLAELATRIDGSEARIEATTAFGPLFGAAVAVRIGERQMLLTTTSLVAPDDKVVLIRSDGSRVDCQVVRVDAALGLVELVGDHRLTPLRGPPPLTGRAPPPSLRGLSFIRWRKGARPMTFSQDLGQGGETEAFFRRLSYVPPPGQAVVDRSSTLRGIAFGPSGHEPGEGLYVPWLAVHEFMMGRVNAAALGEESFSPSDFRP